jgi:hypothetical protein
MTVIQQAEFLRGQVMSLSDRLINPGPLDDVDHTVLLRLVFELDRLGARLEELAEAGKEAA